MYIVLLLGYINVSYLFRFHLFCYLVLFFYKRHLDFHIVNLSKSKKINTSDDEDAIVQTFRTTNCSPECDNCEHSLCVNTVDPDENPNKTFER